MEQLAEQEVKIAQNILYENFGFYLSDNKLDILEIAATNRDIIDYNYMISLAS